MARMSKANENIRKSVCNTRQMYNLPCNGCAYSDACPSRAKRDPFYVEKKDKKGDTKDE